MSEPSVESWGNILCKKHGGENFVCALKEFGGEHDLLRIHPVKLENSLKGNESEEVRKLGENLATVLDRNKLYTEDEILDLVGTTEREVLRQHLWRGTLASIAYQHIRNVLVHQIDPRTEISFDSIALQGGPVSSIGFHNLYPALRRIFQAAKNSLHCK